MKRYVIEGTWSGYRYGQRRICHRHVERGSKPPVLPTAIRFDDGTLLEIAVRLAAHREKVEEIPGYPDLLRDARGQTGYVSIRKLVDDIL